jgi:hypothetical protein
MPLPISRCQPPPAGEVRAVARTVASATVDDAMLVLWHQFVFRDTGSAAYREWGGLQIRIIVYVRSRQVFDLRSTPSGGSPLGKQRLSEMTTV